MSEPVPVANADDVDPGTGIVVDVNGTSLAIFNIEGSFYAIDNTCKHRGGPLGEGDLDGELVTCPWHGWEYNVKTGACITNPSTCLKTYPIVLDGKKLKVEL